MHNSYSTFNFPILEFVSFHNQTGMSTFAVSLKFYEQGLSCYYSHDANIFFSGMSKSGRTVIAIIMPIVSISTFVIFTCMYLTGRNRKNFESKLIENKEETIEKIKYFITLSQAI